MGDFAEVIEEFLLEGWELQDPSMGMESLLICPCGDVIELDGTCPQGCVSPLRESGMI